MGNNMKIIGIIVIVVVLIGGGYMLARTVGTADQTQNITTQMPSAMHGGHDSHTSLVKDERSFIEEMIPHHEEAITSSQELLQVAQTPEIRTLAENIIAAQEKEVADMKSWYKEWFGEEYKPTGNYKPMMSSIEGKTPEEAEQAYLMGMIMHHQAAVDMAEAVQPLAEHDEIKTLADAIIKTQNEEIQLMRGWVHEEMPHHGR
jgi:uncharacterized protein (DUF305 family)